MLTAIVCGLATGAIAETPGVENVAPGVRVIHGDEVPSAGIDSGALEALIKEKHSFRAANKMLGDNGIDSVGPSGTTVHIYKAHDTATGKKLVVLLFVKEDAIVDYSIQDVTPSPAPANGTKQ